MKSEELKEGIFWNKLKKNLI